MSAVQRTRLDGLAVSVMVVVCALWGVQQVASKVALSQGLPPVLQALLRSLIAGPLLVGWVALRRGRPGLRALFAIDASLKPGMITGVMFAAEFLLLFPGVHLTSASHAVVLLFTGGFFAAAALHWLIPAERLRGSQWAGMAMAFAGVVVTVQPWSAGAAPGIIPDPTRDASLLGDLLVIGAAALWGFTTVIVKAVPAMGEISSEKVLTYQLLGAIPFLALATLVSGETLLPHATALAWASLAYQGVVIAFVSYLTWYWLVARYPAGRLSAFSFLTPIFGVAAAALLLGDPVSIGLIGGLVLVSLGLRFVNR